MQGNRNSRDADSLQDAASPADGVFAEQAEPIVVSAVEERITIDRRIVESDAALRVRKIVHEEIVTVDEPLMDEVVEVERIAIGRPVDAPVAMRHEGEVMIIAVVEERVVARKQLVLVEEIHVKRRSQARRAPQDVTVRREEIVVERFDPASGEWRPVEVGAESASHAQPGPAAA